MEKPPGEFELADDFDAAIARRLELRLVERYPWTGDNQIGCCERVGAMPAELELNACSLEVIRRIESVARFGKRHSRSPSDGKLRGSDPAARRTNDHHPPPFNREPLRIHAITAASASSG